MTGKIGTPLDFIAFHAKGAPRVVNGHVRMNVGTQLRDISSGFAIVASYPETKNLPVIIGESDPEGCAACGMATNPRIPIEMALCIQVIRLPHQQENIYWPIIIM